MKQKENYKKEGEKLKFVYFFPVLLAIFLGALFSYFVLSGTHGITGNAVLDVDKIYQDGEIVGGKLNVLLEEGEFIPASSILLFESSNNTYEFVLKDILDSEPIIGDFYLKDNLFFGEGEGYGLPGVKKVYPDVTFKLALYSQEDQETISSDDNNIISEELENEQESNEEVLITEDNSQDMGELVSEEVIEEENISEEDLILTEEVSSDEEFVLESGGEEASESEQEVFSEDVSEDVSESVSITGGVISNILGSVSNFFLGLTMTGNVILDSEVEGKVSMNKPFVYELNEGQTAKVISSSDVEWKIEGNKIIVTTDYFEEEKGFGEAYSGDQKMNLLIDLKKLEIPLNEDLGVRINYEGEDVKTFSIVSEQENILDEKEEIELNLSSLEEEVILVEEKREAVLTEKEKEILFNNFGDIPLKIISAEGVENGVEIKFEFGDYSTIRFYDSGFSKQELESQIEEDRINWLKDIAETFFQVKKNYEGLDDFVGEYPIN